MEFIVELAIGIISIGLSVWFFYLAKKSEKNASDILKKIDVQVDALKEINTRWLDKSINFFTEQKPVDFIEHLPKLTVFFTELKKTILNEPLTQIENPKIEAPKNNNEEDVIISSISCCVYLFFANHYIQVLLLVLLEFIPKSSETTVFEKAKNNLNLTQQAFAMYNGKVDLTKISPNNTWAETYKNIKLDRILNWDLFKKANPEYFVPTNI